MRGLVLIGSGMHLGKGKVGVGFSMLHDGRHAGAMVRIYRMYSQNKKGHTIKYSLCYNTGLWSFSAVTRLKTLR